ncbi:MAG: heme-binding domain-containing protein [Terracidiphilus sp.]|jgi:cytochrome c
MRCFIALALTAAGLILLGFVHPFGDPRAVPPKGLGTLLQDANLPASARAVLFTKCADCHSSETRWPVYARIAPGSWLIERDIISARKHMDLSQWNNTPPEIQQVWAAKIVAEAKSGNMPPVQYLILHQDARLTKADIQALSALSQPSGSSETALAGTGYPVQGKAVFEKRCTGCHALNADREGPRLAGVYGRHAASIAGFAYSKGLKSSGIIWTDVTLEKWLSDPDRMVPDNNMSFSIPKAEERRDLIAFLRQQSAND